MQHLKKMSVNFFHIAIDYQHGKGYIKDLMYLQQALQENTPQLSIGSV